MFREVNGVVDFGVMDAVCVITTNGNIKNDGRAVMGAGIARKAALVHPELQRLLAVKLKMHGNQVYYFQEQNIITFPTKWNFWEKSDMTLIKSSLKQLVKICTKYGIRKVHMSRPGCGNGGLKWRVVKVHVVEALMSEKSLFVVMSLDYNPRMAFIRK